jgi:hypothetical protein
MRVSQHNRLFEPASPPERKLIVNWLSVAGSQGARDPEVDDADVGSGEPPDLPEHRSTLMRRPAPHDSPSNDS